MGLLEARTAPERCESWLSMKARAEAEGSRLSVAVRREASWPLRTALEMAYEKPNSVTSPLDVYSEGWTASFGAPITSW